MSRRNAIIGAGISGLATAYYIQKLLPDVAIDVYESQSRAGGVIKSESISGCIVEGGPDSFLTIKKSASRLCEEIGLGAELVGSNDQFRRTFILDGGELKELPDGFFLMVPTRFCALVSTNLLSWPGKLDALSDLFSFREQTDCSVAEFVERRFGTEVLQKIAEPMISGIYGANVNRLSVQSALPQFWEMQKKGSMILQLLRRKTHAAAESLFTTLENGMESLIFQLQETIRARWIFGQTVDHVAQREGKWMIGQQVYDSIVISGPHLPSIEILEFEELQSIWKSFRRNSAVVVVFGFPALQREGFGWLVPAAERRSILACTYVSNKFPGRSPEDLFLVRTFIGGNLAEKWIDASDDQIRNEVMGELDRIAGIKATPSFSRIFRWPHAMPEYEVSHLVKVERINELIRSHSGLHITGNVFSGVGVPDCIQHAEKVAAALASGRRYI